jgi:hypothetical protein
MAVVKLGKPIKSNLDGPNGAMAYVVNPAKTDGGRLVSSNYKSTSDPDLLAEGMLEDNRNSPRGITANSRLAYHIKLSFSPDDPVTADQVHELGVEFARRITGDDYKFVVATHTDRHHLHNHIMVCAAAADGDHLKAELPKDIIDQWRALCDEICRREGLSVIFNPQVKAQANRMEHDAQRSQPTEDETNRFSKRPATPEQHPTGKHGRATASVTKQQTRVESHASDGMEPERRYGLSMEELYAEAKGKGVKDRIRTLIELCAGECDTLDDLSGMLYTYGIDTRARGQHLIFNVLKTGFKIRDTRLGQAYDMNNVMARLSHSPVLPITFNQRLVARHDTKRNTYTVWLPGTKHQRKIVIPAGRVVRTGSTLRAFLPSERMQTILDKSNKYAGRTPTSGLYEWFGKPNRPIEPLATPERLPVRRGVSPAQQRYYQGQARRLDRLNDQAKALNAAIKWQRAAGGDANKGIDLLRRRVRESRAELTAAVLALHDAIEQNDPDLTVERQQEMESRERDVDRYEGELDSIERAINATREHDREEEETREEQREQPRHRRGRAI